MAPFKCPLSQQNGFELLTRPCKLRPELEEEYEKLKKPLNAFILFSNEVRKGNLTDQRLGLDAAADFANESKVTSEKWKQMSEEEKAPWHEKAQQMKQEYYSKLDELKSKGFRIPTLPKSKGTKGSNQYAKKYHGISEISVDGVNQVQVVHKYTADGFQSFVQGPSLLRQPAGRSLLIRQQNVEP